MNLEQVLMVVREPHVSEKSTHIADKYKQITFRVLKTATKRDIKEAVEKIFQVKVKEVTVLQTHGKRKRFKQIPGQRSGFKKAFVSLLPGYDIDFSVVEQGN